MKPKPFSALNHFTVPCATCAPTFRATDEPSRSGGRGLALPPVNTNVELEPRGKVQQESPKYRSSTHNRYRAVPQVPSRAPPRACGGIFQPIRPDARADFSDGSTRCVGPTTGSSGPGVFTPSPVLRPPVSW